MLYRINKDNKVLHALKEIEFTNHSFKERYDIQEWVESSPEILGEDLLIIAKEFSGFEGTRERADLVALDKHGNIVIIELKRDHSGNDVYLQAIKYASYWSRFKKDHILATYFDYLSKQADLDQDNLNEDSVSQMILEFLDTSDLENINSEQRVILVSHRFSKELITTVDWLIEKHGIDISCVQLIPYHDLDKNAYYLQKQQLLPVPGIEEHFIQPVSLKKNALTSNKQRKTSRLNHTKDSVDDFYEDLFNSLNKSTELEIHQKPDLKSKWAGKWRKYRFYRIWYKDGLWKNLYCCYHFLVENWEKKPKHLIGLRIYHDYLYSKGISENQLKEFIGLIKSMVQIDSEFKLVNNSNYNEGKQWLEIQIEISTNNLKEKESSDILLNKTIVLIKKTFDFVDDTLRKFLE